MPCAGYWIAQRLNSDLDRHPPPESTDPARRKGRWSPATLHSIQQQPQVHRLHGVEPPGDQEGGPDQSSRGVDLVRGTCSSHAPSDRPSAASSASICSFSPFGRESSEGAGSAPGLWSIRWWRDSAIRVVSVSAAPLRPDQSNRGATARSRSCRSARDCHFVHPISP